MNQITILADKIRQARWDAFADAFFRLNMATPVEIEVETLNRALKEAGVENPKELPKLLELVGDNKYLCMTFDIVEENQRITFTGTNTPMKIKAPDAA